MQRKQVALVTGASSGIGEAFAEELASSGYDLIITARREQRLIHLAERLRTRYGAHVEVIPCDLAEQSAASGLCDRLERQELAIDALVNCAGFGLPGRFADSTWPPYQQMLQVMVAAPAELVTRLLPGMIERGSGLIVNVASLAGLADTGAGAMYGAVKTFLVSLSTSLAREVARHGIRVTAVCPGLTRTEFHADPAIRATVVGMPGVMWMEPTDVARQGLAAALAGRPLVINGWRNRLFLRIVRVVPRPVLARVGRLAARVYRRVVRSRT